MGQELVKGTLNVSVKIKAFKRKDRSGFDNPFPKHLKRLSSIMEKYEL